MKAAALFAAGAVTGILLPVRVWARVNRKAPGKPRVEVHIGIRMSRPGKAETYDIDPVTGRIRGLPDPWLEEAAHENPGARHH